MTVEHDEAAEPPPLDAETPPLDAEAPPLDAETLARRAAALRHVRRWGDPVLRERTRRVEEFDENVREEIDRRESRGAWRPSG